MNVDTALDAIMLEHAIKILQRDLPEPGEDENTLDWDTRVRAAIQVLKEKKERLYSETERIRDEEFGGPELRAAEAYERDREEDQA